MSNQRCQLSTERFAYGFCRPVVTAAKGALTVKVDARNVGTAGALGAEFALEQCARWLSVADAHTVVDPGWFATQFTQVSDAVGQTIGVKDWSGYEVRFQRRFVQTCVDADADPNGDDGNLSVSAQTIALVVELQRDGASISWSASSDCGWRDRADDCGWDGDRRQLHPHVRV